MQPNAVDSPRILTTTVGSYPIPDWLVALPSEQSLLDATRVVFNLQRQAGIDPPPPGEVYRVGVNHPDTNSKIFIETIQTPHCGGGQSPPGNGKAQRLNPSHT